MLRPRRAPAPRTKKAMKDKADACHALGIVPEEQCFQALGFESEAHVCKEALFGIRRARLVCASLAVARARARGRAAAQAC